MPGNSVIFMCGMWLRLWNDACVSGHWGRSNCFQVCYPAVTVSATDGQCIALHGWVMYNCEATCHSAAAAIDASSYWRHHRSLTSHKVGFRHFYFCSVVFTGRQHSLLCKPCTSRCRDVCLSVHHTGFEWKRRKLVSQNLHRWIAQGLVFRIKNLSRTSKGFTPSEGVKWEWVTPHAHICGRMLKFIRCVCNKFAGRRFRRW